MNDEAAKRTIVQWAKDDLRDHLEYLKQEGIDHLRSFRKKDGRPAHDDGKPQLIRDLIVQLRTAAPSLSHDQAFDIVEQMFTEVFNDAGR